MRHGNWYTIIIGLAVVVQVVLGGLPQVAAQENTQVLLRFGYGLFSENIQHLAWSPDGSKLATSTASKIQVWDATAGTLLTTMSLAPASSQSTTPNSFDDMAWSPNGRFLAASTDDANINLWDAKTGQLTKTVSASPDRALTKIAWSPDNLWLAAVDSGQYVYLWNTQTWAREREIAPETTQAIASAWSPDSTKLACGGKDGLIRILNIQTGQVVVVTDPGYGEPGSYWPIMEVTWRPDGKWIVGSVTQGDGRGVTAIWNSDTGKQMQTYTLGSGLAWRPDGQRLALRVQSGRQPIA